MRVSNYLFVVSSLFAATLPAMARNPELAAIYEADQAARARPAEIDWSVLLPQDTKRRSRVMELLRTGEVRDAADYHYAAMIFQHGENLDDIRLAHALSTIAMSLAPDKKQYRWLTAASWDRIMATQLQPQWYGTQFQSDDTGMFLYPIAEGAVSDVDRKAMQVPTLAETEAQMREIAKMHGQTLSPRPPTLEQLRKARQATPHE